MEDAYWTCECSCNIGELYNGCVSHCHCSCVQIGTKKFNSLTLYPPVTIIIFHKPIRIHMGSVILGAKTVYMLFCFWYYGHVWALLGVNSYYIVVVCCLRMGGWVGGCGSLLLQLCTMKSA